MRRVNAETMLAAGGIDPDVVRRHLRLVEPRVVFVTVASRWFRRLWFPGIAAICLPWGIYVRPQVMERFDAGEGLGGIATLIAHELTHLEQYRRLGAVRHGIRYVSDYVLGRRRGLDHWSAYRAIGLEREARYVAGMIVREGAS